MSAERVPQKPAPLRLVGSGSDDAVSAWLRVLVQSLRIPAGEADAIREELESHLRERVRDLEITGMTEDDAVRSAVSELGDVPQLAQRYREARAFPRRRLIMNLSMFAMAGAALVVGVATLSRPGDNAGVSVFSPPPPTAEEQTALSRKVQVDFKETPLSDVFSFLSKSMAMPINVAWSSMPGVGPDFLVTFVGKNLDFPTVLAEVGVDLGSGTDWTIDYRVSDGAIRVATDEYFDRREMVLASYDVTPFAGATDDLCEVIQTFVHSPGWVDNGGNMARLSLVGNRMFVEAPKRYHVQIQWFIDELSKSPGHAAADPTALQRKLAVDLDAERAKADYAVDVTRRNDDVKRTMDALASQNAALQADRDAMEKMRRDHQDAMAVASRREESLKTAMDDLALQRASLERVTRDHQSALDAARDQNLMLEKRVADLQARGADVQKLADARTEDARTMQARIDELVKKVEALTRQLDSKQPGADPTARPR